MATVEYAAVVALVSSVVAVGGAAVDARALPGAVGGQIHKALCLVSGGDCLGPGGARPCVTTAASRRREGRLSVFVVRLADGRELVREELSDGTVRVTVAESTGAGGMVRVGPSAMAGARRRAATVEGGASAGVTFGRTFVAPDGPAADRLVARLAAEGHRLGGGARGAVAAVLDRDDDGGDEHERFVDVGAGAEAEAALRTAGLVAEAGALRRLGGAFRVDRRTGGRTLVVHLDRELGAHLGAPLLDVGGSGDATLSAELAVDAAGTPQTLTVRRELAVHGEARIGDLRAGAGSLVQAEARLDLADATTRGLARRALDADLGAARALAGRLASTARLDVRVYDLDRSQRTEGGAVSLAGTLGVERVTSTSDARLTAAMGREPGQGWSRRLDCLLPA